MGAQHSGPEEKRMVDERTGVPVFTGLIVWLGT